MELEPSSSDAASAPAALFAWVRDSAPAPGRLGRRGARRLGAPGLSVGGLGPVGGGPSPALARWEGPGPGAEEERAEGRVLAA